MPRRLACLALLLLAPCAAPPAPKTHDLQARPRLDGTARRAQGQSHQMPPWTEQDLPRHRARLLDLRPRPVRPAKTPACVMVFQDGGGYVRRQGRASACRSSSTTSSTRRRCRSPSASSSTPATSRRRATRTTRPRSNRSFEYDTLSDQYVRFLEKEILPEVAKDYNLRQDADGPGHLRHQLRRHLRLHGGVGAAGPVQQGAEPRRQLHQHPRRRRLPRPDPQDGDRSRSASSCRTAPTTSTTCTATGRWPTSRWRRR